MSAGIPDKFNFKSPTRIHFGVGAVNRLGELVRELGGSRVLVVSDPGLLAAGHVEHACAMLKKSGLDFATFHDFGENPTSAMAERGRLAASEHGVDFLVGLGGGSSMDCAKAINFLLTNGGCMADYRGYGKAQKPLLPMVAVPTTAGTGSETQSYALITEDGSHHKIACGDPKASFRAAILDPQLTVSLPPAATAATGFDAIGHAVESYVTTKRNSFSQFFSLEAWRLLDKNFRRVLERPEDLNARGGMLLGSCLAGVAIENSMLGAIHALANPLTETYGTTHGVAIAILLIPVVRWNRVVADELYEEFMTITERHSETRLEDRLLSLLEHSRLPVRLSQIGVRREDFPALARRAAEQWTGSFNPRPLAEADALSLYESVY
ncbi:MAG: alcohol dehydrogenase [Acidobacteria bacterium]|nr:MAG: alcohol dehydrogenase [Acidobacteriota bacterium]